MQEIEPLIKAVTTLVQIWTLYLMVTWGYSGLQFIGSLFK